MKMRQYDLDPKGYLWISPSPQPAGRSKVPATPHPEKQFARGTVLCGLQRRTPARSSARPLSTIQEEEESSFRSNSHALRPAE
jgi:hypothetical protein